MNNSFNNKKLNFIINIAYIIVVLLLIYVAFKYLLSIVLPFIVAIGICYTIEPTVKVLNMKLKIKRSIASAICTIIVIILLFCILTLLTTTFYNQIKTLVSSLPRFLSDAEQYLKNLNSNGEINFFEKIIFYIYDYLKAFDFEKITSMSAFENILSHFTGLFKSIPNLMLALVITFVFTVFLSSSFETTKKFIYKHISNKSRIILCQTKNSLINVFKKYLKSYFVLMLITFAELSAAFMIFDIQPSFTLAFIIAIVDILPIFGIGTVMIPWGAVTLIFGNYNLGITIFSIYALITVIRQIIEPKIVGTGIGLPPIVTLPAMYIGLKLFGVIGLFVSPIIITVIYDLNRQGYINFVK